MNIITNFQSVKKMLSINKKKKADKSEMYEEIKRLEVFRPIPKLVIQHIEDIKMTMTTLQLNLNKNPSDIQNLVEKLNFFVKYVKHNVLLREYVNLIYSKNKQLTYNLVVADLSQTCDEFSSILKNMLFLNNQNVRVAEMMNEVTQSSRQLKEKRKQVCESLELVLQQRMTYKWSKLKNSENEKIIEKFLNEITDQEEMIISKQIQVARIFKKWSNNGLLKFGRATRVINAQCDGNEDFEDSFRVLRDGGFEIHTLPKVSRRRPLSERAALAINLSVLYEEQAAADSTN